MSAAEKRERLEAAVHAQLARAWKYGLEPGAGRPKSHDAILAAAKAYAEAVADERVNRMPVETLRARLRLAEAAAEADGKAT